MRAIAESGEGSRVGTTLPEPRFSLSYRRVADDGAAGDSDDSKDDRSVSAEFATSATWSLTCLTLEPGLLRLARKVAGEADIAAAKRDAALYCQLPSAAACVDAVASALAS